MKQEKKDKIPVQQLMLPGYILKTSKILTAISPKLATRFASQLFLRPFRYKLPKREEYMDSNTKQATLKIPKTQREIVVYEFGESTKKVLLVHGWSGRGTQLAKIAENLVEKGFSTISFDAPAHGKAAGNKSMMLDFIDSIHFLNNEYGPFHAILGHSLGGMASLRAAKEGLKTNKMVLIGTANGITHIIREFTKNLNMNRKVADRMKARFDKKYNMDMDNYSGAVSAREVNLPCLIIHDKNDVDVEISSAYELQKALKDSELFITEGLGHRRILGDKKVINKITTFITV